jgi:hypothetical protein
LKVLNFGKFLSSSEWLEAELNFRKQATEDFLACTEGLEAVEDFLACTEGLEADLNFRKQAAEDFLACTEGNC